MDKAIATHLKSNFQSGIDFSLSDPNHYLIDDLSEKLNNLSTFSYKHSLIDLFKNRYEIWKNYGKSTIITTNLVPSLSDDLDPSSGYLKLYLDAKTIDRVKEQYQVLVMLGESKRGKI